MICQIQPEITNTTQGNMTVTQYYSKLKKQWDEIVCLEPIPTCSCGATKAMGDIFESHKIIQFLMGLNEL